MKVKVVNADDKCWYNDMIGQTFHVFLQNNIMWFTNNFFIYQHHVVPADEDEEGLIGHLQLGIA